MSRSNIFIAGIVGAVIAAGGLYVGVVKPLKNDVEQIQKTNTALQNKISKIEQQQSQQAEKSTEQPAEKPAEQPTEKSTEKPAEKPTKKPAEKPAEKSSDVSTDGTTNVTVMNGEQSVPVKDLELSIIDAKVNVDKEEVTLSVRKGDSSQKTYPVTLTKNESKFLKLGEGGNEYTLRVVSYKKSGTKDTAVIEILQGM
ncbi:hypothetical protein WAX78_19640 [Bacillus sp. FJAT-53711]|uniref:Uncharacterized protein n=1 Tax=Bacillus yunxiaonensis TaxID=3127665 RepID=A0ABU8G2Y8_9BACI